MKVSVLEHILSLIEQEGPEVWENRSIKDLLPP